MNKKNFKNNPFMLSESEYNGVEFVVYIDADKGWGESAGDKHRGVRYVMDSFGWKDPRVSVYDYGTDREFRVSRWDVKRFSKNDKYEVGREVYTEADYERIARDIAREVRHSDRGIETFLKSDEFVKYGEEDFLGFSLADYNRILEELDFKRVIVEMEVEAGRYEEGDIGWDILEEKPVVFKYFFSGDMLEVTVDEVKDYFSELEEVADVLSEHDERFDQIVSYGGMNSSGYYL